MSFINKLKLKKKKAVSPVIATILIIALTIAAAAIVWLVVMPMLQPNDSLTVSEPSFTDNNNNYFYDQITIFVANSGTMTIFPKAIVIENTEKNINLTWNFTTQSRRLMPGTGDSFTACAIENSTELLGGVNVKLYLRYSTETSDSKAKDWTMSNYYLPELINASADIFVPLQYRTADDDSSTSINFPGPGYSPTLFFLLGAFRNNPSLSSDYILLNTNSIVEQDYRPYLNDTTEFKQGNPSDSGYHFIAYNDSGNYPGLISFYGTAFDKGDSLGWKGPAVVYVGFYIYNPTNNAMDVKVYYQADDNAKIYADGTKLDIPDPSWNYWSSVGANYSIHPGYNYFLFKCQDTGGNFDGQVLFVDTGKTDDLSLLQSRWPILPTQQVTPNDPDALRYRVSSDDTGTSSRTFHGPGYSPHKWFLLGKFASGVSVGSTQMYTDYIANNGYGNESEYRPYLNSPDRFATGIGSETNNSFIAYEDAGNQVGLIDFIGGSSSRFDKGDSLNWQSRGIVYAGTYIYNPEKTSADVSISCQSDDYFLLWVNNELVLDSINASLRWNEWSDLINITLNPGLNYILVKSGDRGGNWDINLLLVDIGANDHLGTFTSVWPTSKPTQLLYTPIKTSATNLNLDNPTKESISCLHNYKYLLNLSKQSYSPITFCNHYTAVTLAYCRKK